MKERIHKTETLMELLGHEEMPFGLCYTNEKPEGFGPKKGEIFSREREKAGEIDFARARENFKCFMKYAPEVGEISLRTEPGVLTTYALYEKDNPCIITIFETYASQDAYDSHIASTHFQKSTWQK